MLSFLVDHLRTREFLDIMLIGEMGLVNLTINSTEFGIQVYRTDHIICKYSTRKLAMKIQVEK